MANIMGNLSKDPQKPTTPLDKIFAVSIYSELRNLYKEITVQGRDDDRSFIKNYSIEKVPTLDHESIAGAMKDIMGNKDGNDNTEDKMMGDDNTEDETLGDNNTEDIMTRRAAQMIEDIDNDTDTRNVKMMRRKLADNISWEYPPDIPASVADMVEHVREKLQMPSDTPCDVYMGLFMRRSRMIAPLPKEKTISRVVVNLKYKDMYNLTQPYDGVGRPVTVRQVMLDEDSIMMLGPAGICGFNVMVNSNPKYKIPGNMPPGVPGMRNINREKFTIRPPSYERITLILDYGTSKKMSLQLSNGQTDSMSNPNLALQSLVGKIGPSILQSMYPSMGQQSEESSSRPSQDNVQIPSSLKNMVPSGAMRKARRRQKRKEKNKDKNKDKKNQNNGEIDIDEFIKARDERRISEIEHRHELETKLTGKIDESVEYGSDDEEIEKIMTAARSNDGKNENP
jgi:hypothetical protein